MEENINERMKTERKQGRRKKEERKKHLTGEETVR